MPTPIYPSWNDKEYDLLKKMTENTALIADYEIGDVASVAGTANQLLVNGGTAAATGNITLSLPSTLIAPGNLTVSGTTTLAANTWLNSSDSLNRAFFLSSGTTYYKGHGLGVIHEFRNAADTTAFQLTNALNGILAGNLTVNGTGTSSFGGKIQSSVATATGYNQLYDTTGITTGRGAFAITSTGAGLAFGIEASVGGTSFANSTAYASYFGSTTATPVHFVANASIGATLTSGGNLGIGTTTPSDLLSLEGTDTGTTIGAGTVAMRLVNLNAGGLGRLTEIHFGGRSQSAKPFAAISGVLVSDSLGQQAGDLAFSVKNVTTATNPVEAMRLFANGNLFIGASPVDGGQKLQVSGTANIGNPFSTSTDDSLILHGKAVSDGSGNYGDYGSIVLSSSSSFTASARRYLITNAYLATDFAIIRSTNATTTPTIGTNGVVSSGTVDFRISESGNATFSGAIAIGNTVNTVSPTSPNRTITMVIGGTTYYIHAKTTND